MPPRPVLRSRQRRPYRYQRFRSGALDCVHGLCRRKGMQALGFQRDLIPDCRLIRPAAVVGEHGIRNLGGFGGARSRVHHQVFRRPEGVGFCVPAASLDARYRYRYRLFRWREDGQVRTRFCLACRHSAEKPRCDTKLAHSPQPYWAIFMGLPPGAPVFPPQVAHPFAELVVGAHSLYSHSYLRTNAGS